jgi:hypothetical protein
MAFKLWRLAKEKKEEQEQEKNDRKPAPYKHIKVGISWYLLNSLVVI